ncbi:hypothetical protein KEF85_05380 [Methylomonas paludis]|uniref:Uncharacterized protein n=1 Tax=Methylomonas paludis TaxID=1173101 RepID=A0A975MQ64_9GAMM|nr:hypothetical protein [Methylomonas paludis]QWF71890.1 hypothetical protein KEF85_05380 [Methylomonas paludis]
MLLTFDEYQKLTGGRGCKIADLLALPGSEDIELEIPAMRELVKPADFN